MITIVNYMIESALKCSVKSLDTTDDTYLHKIACFSLVLIFSLCLAEMKIKCIKYWYYKIILFIYTEHKQRKRQAKRMKIFKHVIFKQEDFQL